MLERARLADVALGAKEDMVAFLSGDFTPEALEESRDAMAVLLERGVRLRVLYLQSNVMDPDVREYVWWLTLEGALVKSVTRLPARFVLVDDSLAVVASNTPGFTGEGVLVRAPEVIAALSELFETYWERSGSISASAAGGAVLEETPAPITRQEQNVLTLLARGMKDEEIAAHLGISVRTVARTVNQLYEHTGSRTRFHLGVKAARFGWA